MDDLLKKYYNLVKHRQVGPITLHFHHIFQLTYLAYHLLQTLVIPDQQPDMTLIAILNRQAENASNVKNVAGKSP